MSDVIEHREGAGGTSAYVGSTRVRVSDIAQMFEALHLEFMVERIREQIPHLTESEIIAAIRYWQDHPEEIAEEMERDEEAVRAIKSAM